MRFSVRLLASALLSAAALTANARAETIHFSLSGSDGTFAFSLPGMATPLISNSYFNEFALASATYNGQILANDTVSFYTPADNGGLYLTTATGSAYFSAFGQQIFSGTPSSPIFTSGTFTLTNGSSLVDGVTHTGSGDVLTVAITPDPLSTVPEPASLALFGSGAAGLIGLLRDRRLRRQS